jgi:hypothetical protein
MDDKMLGKWRTYRDKMYPELVGLPITKVVYDPSTVQNDTGLPNQYLDYYSRPSKMMDRPAPQTGNGATSNNAVAPTKQTRYYRHPNTGEVLDPAVYGSFEGYEDKQLGQYMDMASLKSSTARQETQNRIAQAKEILATMTLEQIADMKSKQLTPIDYAARHMRKGGKLNKNNGILYR